MVSEIMTYILMFFLTVGSDIRIMSAEFIETHQECIDKAVNHNSSDQPMFAACMPLEKR